MCCAATHKPVTWSAKSSGANEGVSLSICAQEGQPKALEPSAASGVHSGSHTQMRDCWAQCPTPLLPLLGSTPGMLDHVPGYMPCSPAKPCAAHLQRHVATLKQGAEA
jgi:hypothetical protein